MKISAVILTKNEELHIARCIESISGVVDEIIIIDSFSTDRTLSIIDGFDCKVIKRDWVNYSDQFSFGQSKTIFDWVLRIDADEIIDLILQDAIMGIKKWSDPEVNAYEFNRDMCFLNQKIRYGGVFPVKVIRLFNKNHGSIEQRWMDEHIKVRGSVRNLPGSLVDDNLNNLTWWINKHNSYACREAYEYLASKHLKITSDSVASFFKSGQSGVKRYVKEHIYYQFPAGFRSYVYFLYRFYIRLGFLGSKAERNFHYYQALWYRGLVDTKIWEAENLIHRGVQASLAIDQVTGINVREI
jgi:glycosyltransferase involved in cell wall biosynthesis